MLTGLFKMQENLPEQSLIPIDESAMEDVDT
jgi:hypothetical protein